jgi:hypothetical protein
MIEFPKININQFTLLRCEYNTGHVLDVNLQLYIQNPNQIVYTTCESYNEALEIAKNIVFNNNTIEVTIFDSKQEPVKVFNVESLE